MCQVDLSRYSEHKRNRVFALRETVLHMGRSAFQSVVSELTPLGTCLRRRSVVSTPDPHIQNLGMGEVFNKPSR